jgi:hypothetical protein
MLIKLGRIILVTNTNHRPSISAESLSRLRLVWEISGSTVGSERVILDENFHAFLSCSRQLPEKTGNNGLLPHSSDIFLFNAM